MSEAHKDAEREALLASHIELNMSNYGPDDVDKLNAWALDAYDFINRAASPQAPAVDGAEAVAKVETVKMPFLERIGEKLGLLTPIEPFYEKGDFGRETRELTFSQIQEIVTKAIGFEWSGGEMQTLNAPDLLKLAHAIIDAAKGVDHD